MIKLTHDNPKKYAFTLIELIVVIIIIGILASIAVPAYNSYTHNTKLKANASLKKNLEQVIDNHLLQGGLPLWWGANGMGDFMISQVASFHSYEEERGESTYNSSHSTFIASGYYFFPALIYRHFPVIQTNAFCKGNNAGINQIRADASNYAGQTWLKAHDNGSSTGLTYMNPVGMGISITYKQVLANGHPVISEPGNYEIRITENPSGC